MIKSCFHVNLTDRQTDIWTYGRTLVFIEYLRYYKCISLFSDKVSVNVIEPSSFYDAKIPAGSKNDGTYEQFR